MTILSAIVMLGILIFVHELGHFIFAKIMGVGVLKFSLGFGPKIVGRKIGETEYMVSAVPLGGYVKMIGEEIGDEISEQDKDRAFQVQPIWKRALIVFAGPFFNVLLAYLVYTSVLAAQVPINIPNVSSFMPVVGQVVEGTPAADAGISPGDRIVKIGNVSIDTWFNLVDEFRKNPGKELSVTIKRDGEIIEKTITPKSVEVEEDGKKVTIGQIGILKAKGELFDSIESQSFGEAVYKGGVATYKMAFFIYDSIGLIFSGQVSLKNVGGPVTIVKESGKAAALGILPYFLFMALFSVNLGILNLLPIPVLDGGHLLLFALEGIKGGPLNEKAVNVVNRIGLAFLLALMVLAFYNDIVRLLTGK